MATTLQEMETTESPLHEAPSAEELRAQFLLDPEVVFLNHGSFGACPRPVFEIYQAWQRQLEREPVLFVGRRQDTLLDAARTHLAAYLNVADTDLSFVVNATSGLNVIARSLLLQPGDEILTTDLEYGALDLTWDHLCTRAGASYIHQPIPVPFTTSEAIVDALWEGVTERTRAIFLSHITSATSVILPVAEICARAREAGILTIIDGAHAPGQIPLDLTALGVDIYAGNCHKWLSAPKGAGFLYVRPEEHAWVESLPISWGWRPGHTFVTRNQKQGTRDVSAWLSVPRAIDFQTEHQWPLVRERCHAMLADLRQRLHARFGTEPLYSDDQLWYRQMAVISVPVSPETDDLSLRHRFFINHGIEVPFMSHRDRRFVRVSVQGYTTEADLNALEEALVHELG